MTRAGVARRQVSRVLRVAGIALGAYLTRVIVEPVRKGRLRDVGWPAGLRPIAVVGLVGYVVAAALIVLAGPLREALPLVAPSSRDAMAVPASLVWLVFALVALSLTLAYSGSLHAPPWLRWLVTGFVALVVLFVGAIGSTLDHPRIVAAAVAAALVLLTALRGHRPFAWWEFAVAAALVWGSLVTSAAGLAATARPFGLEFMPILLGLMLVTLGQLAVPSALAAGASVAKFAVSSAIWAARTVRDRIGGRAVVVALVLVAAWRVLDLVLSGAGLIEATPASPERIAGALLLLALIVAAWGGIRLLRRGGGIPSAPAILDRIDLLALAVAAVTSVPIVSVLARISSQVLVGFGLEAAADAVLSVTVVTSGSVTIAVARALGGAGLLVLAAVQARRGHRTLPELYAAIGLAMILLAATWLSEFALVWDGDALATVGTVAALVGLAVALVRRRFTAEVAVSGLVALLISALFASRQVLVNPISFALGFSTIAVVLFGFVWSFLTGYGKANGDSARYPRAARVQLVIANSLFGLTVLAYTALARDPDVAINLGGFARYGSSAFGDPLLASGLLIAVASVLAGRAFEMAEDAPAGSPDAEPRVAPAAG